MQITDVQQAKQLRKAKNLSLKALEGQTGISKKVLYNIEAEENNIPTELVTFYIDAVNSFQGSTTK